jgi:hypothetical protein
LYLPGIKEAKWTTAGNLQRHGGVRRTLLS